MEKTDKNIDEIKKAEYENSFKKEKDNQKQII